LTEFDFAHGASVKLQVVEDKWLGRQGSVLRDRSNCMM
jgi:hypothetical protein